MAEEVLKLGNGVGSCLCPWDPPASLKLPSTTLKELQVLHHSVVMQGWAHSS